MKNTFVFLILVLLFSGCRQKTECTVDPKLLKSNDSILSEIKKGKNFKYKLSLMKEPELETLHQEAYRFMIMNSFGTYHTYRVTKKKMTIVLPTKPIKGIHLIPSPLKKKQLIACLNHEHK